MTKQFLTTEEASQFLNLSPIRLYQLVKEERIPYLRVIRKILFDPGELEVWVRRHREELEPEVLEN